MRQSGHHRNTRDFTELLCRFNAFEQEHAQEGNGQRGQGPHEGVGTNGPAFIRPNDAASTSLLNDDGLGCDAGT